MKNRTLALTLALVLSLVFVGCTGTGTVTPTDVTQTDVSKLDTNTGEADEVSTSASEVDASSEVSTSSEVAASSEPAKEAAASTVKKSATSKAEKPSNTVSSKPASNNSQSSEEDEDFFISHDIENIERLAVKYINEYRVEEGNPPMKILGGKAYQYAKIRSQQLVTDFSHNTEKIRSVAEQLEYGTYTVIDPADCNNPAAIEELKKLGLWHDDVTTYWQPPGTEACGISSQNWDYYNDDTLARRIAKNYHDSSGHWNYVGNSTNIYISIGITVSAGVVYDCTHVLPTDEYD